MIGGINHGYYLDGDCRYRHLWTTSYMQPLDANGFVTTCGQVAPGKGGGMDTDNTASAVTPTSQNESGTTTWVSSWITLDSHGSKVII